MSRHDGAEALRLTTGDYLDRELAVLVASFESSLESGALEVYCQMDPKHQDAARRHYLHMRNDTDTLTEMDALITLQGARDFVEEGNLEPRKIFFPVLEPYYWLMDMYFRQHLAGYATELNRSPIEVLGIDVDALNVEGLKESILPVVRCGKLAVDCQITVGGDVEGHEAHIMMITYIVMPSNSEPWSQAGSI